MMAMNTSTTSTVRFTKKRKEPTCLKKSVSFLPSVLVYRTLHINDFTDEEIEKTWYGADEMATIVNECVKTIASMDNNQGISSEQSFRGLEVRTPEAQKKRTAHRFCAIDAVLGEQEAQWQNEENDIQKIRQIYLAYSKLSEAEAYRFGLQDAKEAMSIYQEGELCSLERRTKRRSSSDRRCIRSQTQVSSVMTLAQQMQYHSPIGRAA